MGACEECGAESYWLPTYMYKKEPERQAGQHCYLKTLIWCPSLQVTLVRYGVQSRSGDAPGCSLRMESACLPSASGLILQYLL